MKKSSVFVALLLMLGLLMGCTTQFAEKSTEAQIEAQTGGNADVDIDSGKMSVETDEGKVTVETNAQEAKGWCDAGTQWKYSADMASSGQADAQWNIVGLMDSGDYKGLCHVVYEATTPQGKTTMDYYFTQDGKSGYFEMNVNSQKIKQEWKSTE